MHAPNSIRPEPIRRLTSLGLLTSLLGTLPAVAAPVIQRQPLAVTVYETQSATFTVEATGTPPLRFQWRRNGTGLEGATNSALVIANLAPAQAGFYSVEVSDSSGSILSEAPELVVLPRPMPGFIFGSFGAGATPEVPVRLIAHGGETRATFTVTYDANRLANPRFLPDPSGFGGGSGPARSAVPAAEEPPSPTLVTDTSIAGRFGVDLRLPAGAAFGVGPNELGRVQFDALPGAGPFEAGLGWADAPLAPTAGPVTGTNAVASVTAIGPGLRVTAPPVLDAQSGLFLQSVEIGNPGVVPIEQVRLTVSGLTNDSLGLPIRVYNSLGSDASGAALVYSDRLLAGERRWLRVEFYVADLVSVPAPRYSVETIAAIPGPSTGATLLAVDRARHFTSDAFPDGAFLIEFPTEAGRNYFVQYAPTPEAFAQGPAAVKTARPAIRGTGSRVQWIDYGPPKTDSVPGMTNRFYRVIVGQ